MQTTVRGTEADEGLLPYVPPIEVVSPPPTIFGYLHKVKNTPMSLIDLGPPKYESEDRSLFCRLYREDPESLQNFIAYGILCNPSMNSKELNRLLFNAFGARAHMKCVGCLGVTDSRRQLPKF